MNFSARIVILNYNGRELLEKCLPSIVRAAVESRYGCAVTVLDNCSTDGSRDWVKSRDGGVDWTDAPKNEILCSYNAYAQTVSEKYLIFLNNDIRVEPDFVDPLLSALERDKDIFFATPYVKSWNTGEYEGSLSKMQLRWGLLWGDARFPGYEKKIHHAQTTMQCGFGAFRRDFFLKLGGYDHLYLPGTVEDSDLCFRAYRQGWRGQFVPESVVHHIGQASFKKEFGNSRLRRMNRRNLYLFVWKNIRDPFYLLWHVVCIPVHLIKYLLKGEADFILGFIEACARFPEAMRRRKACAQEKSVRTDRKIFSISRAI